jgi:hypothetical protein
MARRLKTYQTSLGFFDLAVAAPSMKAALAAWGSTSNLFHQGFAKEATDPAIIAAATARPGVVLRRPVGSREPFSEHAGPPKHLPADRVTPPAARERPKRKPPEPPRIDDKAARAAARAFERERERRDRERHKEEVARERQRERRARAAAKAEAALERARRDHERRAGEIDSERAKLEERARAEAARWAKEKERLDAALDRARD